MADGLDDVGVNVGQEEGDLDKLDDGDDVG